MARSEAKTTADPTPGAAGAETVLRLERSFAAPRDAVLPPAGRHINAPRALFATRTTYRFWPPCSKNCCTAGPRLERDQELPKRRRNSPK